MGRGHEQSSSRSLIVCISSLPKLRPAAAVAGLVTSWVVTMLDGRVWPVTVLTRRCSHEKGIARRRMERKAATRVIKEGPKIGASLNGWDQSGSDM